MHTNKKYNKVIEEWRIQAMLSYLYTCIKEVDSQAPLLEVISKYQDFVAQKAYNEKEEKNDLFKALVLDTLVFRYKQARYAMAELEFHKDYEKGELCEKESFKKEAKEDIENFSLILTKVFEEK